MLIKAVVTLNESCTVLTRIDAVSVNLFDPASPFFRCVKSKDNPVLSDGFNER